MVTRYYKAINRMSYSKLSTENIDLEDTAHLNEALSKQAQD